MEHVCAKKGTAIYYIQQLLNIPWHYWTRCDMTRKVYENVQQAGFDKVEYDVFEAYELIYPVTAMYLLNMIIKSHASGVGTK